MLGEILAEIIASNVHRGDSRCGIGGSSPIVADLSLALILVLAHEQPAPKAVLLMGSGGVVLVHEQPAPKAGASAGRRANRRDGAKGRCGGASEGKSDCEIPGQIELD